mmetsp:Transcript_18751/g.46679  ORF Transcript_18751/g.46679 Transcript_18751/m.46679 type:complete len:120 (+) Transcript_18751:635-994(+)
MLFGLLFSLKQFALKMDPKEATSQPCYFYAFRTNNYKFHVLETATGLMLLLTTDASMPDMSEHLLHVSNVIHDGVVVKNPIARPQVAYMCADFLNAVKKHFHARKARMEVASTKGAHES